MPYIGKNQRILIQNGNPAGTVGELNYKITKTILEYIDICGESYQAYNDILGVLTAIQHELYDRKIRRYEDKKIKLNGDVYERH